MPQRAAQKAESRAAIIRAAADLVRSSGAEGTSVQHAMKGAGLTVGAFYAHFTDKTELIDEAYRSAIGQMTARVLDAVGSVGQGSPLQPVITEYLSEEHRDHPDQGCPLPALLGEASHHGSPLPADALGRGFQQMRDTFMQIDPNIDQRQADALLALLVGSQIVARALNGTPLSAEVLDAAGTHAAAIIEPTSSTPSPPTSRRKRAVPD